MLTRIFVRRMMIAACLVTTAALGTPARAQTTDPWAQAAKNASQAGEAFSRARRDMYAYYTKMNDRNALLPRNAEQNVWKGKDNAADLYSFFVITSYMLDREAYGSFVRSTLRDEILLTTRVGWLTDDLDIGTEQYANSTPGIDRMTFNSAEYVKDGLLPIIELTGRNVYLERACGLLESVMANAPVKTRFGLIPSDSAEVCGDMLQGLSRLYATTGNPNYKLWAERIGKAWMYDVLPNNYDLPSSSWDFTNGRPEQDRLLLIDHGNELIFGLSELLMLEHVYDPGRRNLYLPPMRKMIDKLLATAVNEDGLWYMIIQPSTGQPLSTNVPDTWGYALNAVYIMYMVTGEQKYLDAVKRAVNSIVTKPRYLNWGGDPDAHFDSLESGILMYSRLKDPRLMPWMDTMAREIMDMQRSDDLVMDTYLDGNFCRTMMMYGLMKSGGATLHPWREDLKIGAYVDKRVLYLYLSADKPWQGKLHLDFPRHKHHMGLQIDYPRLNHFPQWYTAEPTKLFDVRINARNQRPILGDELDQGWPITLEAGKPMRIDVRPMIGPPYGQ